MRRASIALLALLLLLAVSAGTAMASCLRTTAAEQRNRAHVIFDGVALDGATASGIQRFRVIRYLKGRGPRIVRVSTGNVKRADGTGSITSVSIFVTRGERWRIFAQGNPRKVLRTTLCDGSRRR